MQFAPLILASAVAGQSLEFDKIVEAVNTPGRSWQAAVPTRFASVDDVKILLGAYLPGDVGYDEPAVATLATGIELPSSFDSQETWPECTVIGNIRDQSACGSCWAFASTSSFESRACIATGKDVKYSPEHTAGCSGAGCGGGYSVWAWFQKQGVVTGGDYTDIGSADTCLPYSLAPCAHHVPATAAYPECPSSEYRLTCHGTCSESNYSGSFKSDKLRAATSYSIRTEEQIMTDLVSNGPTYASFQVYSDFPAYKSGVYYHTTGSSHLGGHAVTLVGYGEVDGEKYWKMKNSWNEEWGDNGHFLIRRGSNECGIESGISAGTISASTVV